MILRIMVVWVVVCCGCNNHSSDHSNNDYAVPQFKTSLMLSDSIRSILGNWSNKTGQPNPKDSIFFLVTYSPECPISIAHVSDLQVVIRYIDSVKSQRNINNPKIASFMVITSEELPTQYQWLQAYTVLDTGFCKVKQLGFTVYPELHIYQGTSLKYSAKLSNRALQAGEKSLINRNTDSSYLLLQWKSANSKQGKFLPSNSAVGCFIE